MTDQWFLDLDGTRSGPYQTNEILSLIAEGEVLPHHRIARGLKDPNWKTILDWRLEHARQAPAAPSPARKSASPPASPPAPPPAEVPAEEPALTPAQEEFKKEIEAMERNTAAPSVSPDGVKRDPMAEMFDLLQNTKQKREAKQIQQAQQAQQEALPPSNPQSPEVGRWIAICSVMAVIGLAAGQWLQYTSRKTEEKPAAALKTGDAAPAEAKTEAKKEMIDRSTDKLTIKAMVDKKPEPAKVPTPFPKYTPHAAPSHPVALHPDARDEKKHSEKELEELRDLKKELQELKALKEQLRETPLTDESMEEEAPPFNPDAAASPGPGAPDSQAGSTN